MIANPIPDGFCLRPSVFVSEDAEVHESMTQANLADLRRDYTVGGLSETEAGDDPLALFQAWFTAAQGAGLTEANAMTLATVGPDGRPSARVVLLKGLDDRGFTFFTNRQSRKAKDMLANPFAALVFLWHELERQVRIEGRVEMVSDVESDEYFSVRPRNSRLGAWASPQSQTLANREELERRMQAFHAEYGETDIPRPPHWGGYRVIPDLLEFWQGRPSRLHDRIRFRLIAGVWVKDRLAP